MTGQKKAFFNTVALQDNLDICAGHRMHLLNDNVGHGVILLGAGIDGCNCIDFSNTYFTHQISSVYEIIITHSYPVHGGAASSYLKPGWVL